MYFFPAKLHAVYLTDGMNRLMDSIANEAKRLETFRVEIGLDLTLPVAELQLLKGAYGHVGRSTTTHKPSTPTLDALEATRVYTYLSVTVYNIKVE